MSALRFPSGRPAKAATRGGHLRSADWAEYELRPRRPVHPSLHTARKLRQRALESDRVHLVIRQEHRAAQAVFGADVALHDPRAAAQHDRGQGAQVKSRFGHQREQPFGVGAALPPDP